MLLAIDCGNTNTVFAVMQGGEVRGTWRISTDRHRTADEYAVWLTQLMALQGFKPAEVDGAIIATVVPDQLFALKSLARRHFGCEPLVVGEDALRLPVKVLLDRPEEAGADRIVDAVAAHARYGGPLIVVDFGTATTFDVVDGQGNYAGGVIAPGITLSLDALYMAAAKLPRIAIKKPQAVIGKGTITAMQSGTYWGYVGLIEGLVARIRAEFGAPMRVIATGGLASLFEQATDVIDDVEPDLTMHGLALIYAMNRKGGGRPA
jgi:type III pantothenate kinase